MSALSKVRAVVVRKDDTKRMEEEARRMEAKLELLRRTLDANEPCKASPGASSEGRWRGGAAGKPLTRGYVKQVLEAPAPRARSQPQRPERPGRGDGGAGTPTQRPADGTCAELLRGGPVYESERSPLAAPSPASAASGASPAAPAGRSAGQLGGAAGNLRAAIEQQSQDAREVETFLVGQGLDRYVRLFLDNGFDCMEVVLEMEENHMRELGMPSGHCLKLRKRIAELKGPAVRSGDATLRPAQVSANALQSATIVDAEASQRRVTFGGSGAGPAAGPVPSGPVPRSGHGASQAAPASASLAEGAFDEQESAASFQEALRAWREGHSEPSTARASSGTASTPKVAGSFWSTVGGGEMDLNQVSTPVRPPTEVIEEKLCCYQCFKQFYAKFAVERTGPVLEGGGGGTKRLCSERCADLWLSAVQAKAEQVQKRLESLEKMREMERLLEEESRGAAVAQAVDHVGADGAPAGPR